MTHAPQDKAALVRSVDLFLDTPAEIVEQIAAMLEPKHYESGEVIFHKGDYGDCLFIVGQGSVQIHDADLVLSELCPGDVFGEMALLDAETRMACATATEHTIVFRLGQEPFYQLMTSESAVTRGVIRVLCKRLRARVDDMIEGHEYIQQIRRIAATAQALESGVYVTDSLGSIGERDDSLGLLARVFQRMANEVQAREQRLTQQVQQLQVEIDEVKRALDVQDIVKSDSFQRLQKRVKEMRRAKENPQT